MSNKQKCNDMIKEIMTRIDNKGVADTTYDIKKIVAHYDYENIRTEGNKKCADFYFSNVDNSFLCKVEYPDWAYSNSCENEWTRFMEAIQRHESGHCLIAKKYNDTLINELKTKKIKICGKDNNDLTNNAKNEMDAVFRRTAQLYDFLNKKEQNEYDRATNHGQTQGIYFDCNKCQQ